MKSATQTKELQIAGFHLLAELHNCNKEKISFLPSVKRAILNSIEKAKLTKLGENFHQFEPYGVTGIILLAESHLSVHTWPELSYAAVDIFTCGDAGNAKVAFECLAKELEAKHITKKEFYRGSGR